LQPFWERVNLPRSDDLNDLLSVMLDSNPDYRCTVDEILRGPWLKDEKNPTEEESRLQTEEEKKETRFPTEEEITAEAKSILLTFGLSYINYQTTSIIGQVDADPINMKSGPISKEEEELLVKYEKEL
jgi:serine/threonine protein kinase